MEERIYEDKISIAQELIELKIYDVIESVDGAFPHELISKKKKVTVKSLDFYPCKDTSNGDLVFIARKNSKIFKMVFPDINEQEILVLQKYNKYIKRAEKFNPSFLIYLGMSFIAGCLIVSWIYEFIISA